MGMWEKQLLTLQSPLMYKKPHNHVRSRIIIFLRKCTYKNRLNLPPGPRWSVIIQIFQSTFLTFISYNSFYRFSLTVHSSLTDHFEISLFLIMIQVDLHWYNFYYLELNTFSLFWYLVSTDYSWLPFFNNHFKFSVRFFSPSPGVQFC